MKHFSAMGLAGSAWELSFDALEHFVRYLPDVARGEAAQRMRMERG